MDSCQAEDAAEWQAAEGSGGEMELLRLGMSCRRGRGKGREENRNQEKHNSTEDTLLTLGCLASSLAACLSVSHPSSPPYVSFLPPTSQTPRRRGRFLFYGKDPPQKLKMRRQSSTVGVRNRQRKTCQQALIHCDFTLT